MSLFAAARLARLALQPSKSRTRRRRLALESLEDRAVPANDITIVDVSTPSDLIDVKTTGQTTTISTTGPGAILSLQTIQDAMTDTSPNVRNVVVTTAVAQGETDGGEPGDINWDGFLFGSLDFTGFVAGRNLIFRTVGDVGATGAINLSGVSFENPALGGQINLEFDSSAANGDINFSSFLGFNTLFTAEAVQDVTVNAGTGAFTFMDDGFNTSASAGAGVVSFSAGAVTVAYAGGVSAGTDFTISGDTVDVVENTILSAINGNLGITGATSASVGDNAQLSAGRNLSVTAPDAGLGAAILNADDNITLAGAGTLGLAGSQATAGGKLDLNGGDITISNSAILNSTGALTINGSSSVTLDTTDIFGSGDVSIFGGALSLTGLNMDYEGFGSITGTTVDLSNTTVTTTDGTSLVLFGNSISTDSVVLGSAGGLSIHGDLTASNLLDVRAVGDIFFNDAVDGAADLFVESHTNINFSADIGGLTPLNSVTFSEGLVKLGANDLSATSITVGSVFDPIEATLSGGATITGDIDVASSGNLAPGGLGTAGTTTIRGNVNLGGDFAVDFGAAGATDQLRVRDNPATVGTMEGDVTIGFNSRLGGGLGTGMLTAPSATIIDYSGTLIGQFLNANVGVAVLAGTDALTVTTYGPPGVVVIPVPADADGIVTGADQDDGSLFKAVLTGGGQLVYGKDWTDAAFLVVRNATPTTKLTVTTTANGADPAVSFNAGVLINGPLAAFAGPKVNIGSQFRATGAVKSVVMRDLLNVDPNTRIEFGGTVLDKTTIVARNLFGSVITTSTLSLLKTSQALGAQVFTPFLPDSKLSAPAIGTVTANSATIVVNTGRLNAMTVIGDMVGGLNVASLGTLSAGSFSGDVKVTGAATTIKTARRFDGTVKAGSLTAFTAGGGGAVTMNVTGAVGSVIGKGSGLALDLSAGSVKLLKVPGALSGNGGTSNVTNGISSLTAGSIADLNLTAKFLGTVLVSGNVTLGIAGDIANSTFTLTGNDGTLGAFGIKSLTAKGRVDASRFDVERGNVGPVVVGRFYNSQLYLNYTPDAVLPFNQGGTFGNPGFKLTSFKTTAVPTPDPSNPFQWAFRGSEIAADTIGTVTLSGLSTDNFGQAFGIKVRKPGAIVKVMACDDLAVPLNTNLTADNSAPYTPISGDFYFIDV